MAKKIIEAVALILGVVITVGVCIAIPMKSYNEYKDYLAEIEKQNEANKQQAIRPVLESITAELKEGVTYYANDMAEARPEHFTVTANYTKEGEEPWSETVEEDKFSIHTNADFYSKGGTVTVKYKSASTTVEIALAPVLLEKIEVALAPYSIVYQSGSTFDPAGMIVTATYSDGSSKVLADDQYTVDTSKVLAIGDVATAVSFTDGEVTKTADVGISVVEELNNGPVKSIVIVDGAIVNVGSTINDAIMEVNAVYGNGNRKPLSPEEYSITGTNGEAVFGKTYHLTVAYNGDSSKTASTDVIVRHTVQAETGDIVGGAAKTETEYAVIDGVITKLDSKVSFAGNFSKAVQGGNEGSITLTVSSASETVGNITMRCSNSYCVYANGVNDTDGYLMKPLQINTILDLTVNGREVRVPATVILRGCGPYESYAPLYGIYYEFTFENVELDAGVNYVKFDFKRSSVGAANCWGESPSTLNIDYVNFDSLGSVIPNDYTITGIEISSGYLPKYGQKREDVEKEIPVIATLDNGSKISLEPGLCDVEISGGEEGYDTIRFGTYTLKATLKDNPSLTTSLEVEVPTYYHFVVLKAGVELVNDRVIYYFTGESIGYVADDVELFDGGTVYTTTIKFNNDDTFRMEVDVTDEGYGVTYWPHIRLDGKMYDNGGANKNGDVRGRGLEFTNGEIICFGGKSYTITEQYSMPTLVIGKHVTVEDKEPIYDANVENSYVSDKALLGEYVWGSEGVETSGKDKSSEFAGGIGDLDKPGGFLSYTFTLDTAAKVDFIWNIAGSKYNSTTDSNDGIDNAGDHMTVSVDGELVDMDGILLPIGESVWWNVQQVVIKDVELEAGTHTFVCYILAEGAGINAGAMEIYAEPIE